MSAAGGSRGAAEMVPIEHDTSELTHRSFKTTRALRSLLAVLGSGR